MCQSKFLLFPRPISLALLFPKPSIQTTTPFNSLSILNTSNNHNNSSRIQNTAESSGSIPCTLSSRPMHHPALIGGGAVRPISWMRGDSAWQTPPKNWPINTHLDVLPLLIIDPPYRSWYPCRKRLRCFNTT